MDDTLKVMVVDDERVFRQALVSGIDWDTLGLQVVMAAQHAFEALEYVRNHSVDIVLTDIRMPVKDGLEMISDMQAMGKTPVFVLLTGYGEFDYAQKALRLGVRDYLLKPVDEETVVALMTRLRGELLHSKMARALQAQQGAQAPADAPSGTVGRILDIIKAELGNEALSLKWISQSRIFLNENYLSKLFQREVGARFSAYLLNRRMQRAMALLAGHADVPVARVAADVGFGDNAGYFSSVFKKHTGYTPTEYRRIFHQHGAE